MGAGERGQKRATGITVSLDDLTFGSRILLSKGTNVSVRNFAAPL
jgi:hypothetical protein